MTSDTNEAPVVGVSQGNTRRQLLDFLLKMGKYKGDRLETAEPPPPDEPTPPRLVPRRPKQ